MINWMMTNEWIDDGWKEWRKKTDCYVTQHNNYSKLHSTLHYIQYITLQYITVHYSTLRYNTIHVHYIAIHYITVHCNTLHYSTLQYITLQYITVHYTTLQYITLHYITLQYKPRVGEMTHEWTSGYQKNTINYTTKRCVQNT